MIRNLVMVKLIDDADPGEIATIQEGLANLDLPGCVSYTIGDDLGLREGNWSFGIVADFEDEDAYRAYDVQAEHNEWRARLAPLTASVARLQFRVES